MKKSFYFILLLTTLVFASCKNFMNANDVKSEIEDMIREANAKTVKLVITQDNTMGTFLSSGDKECKLGYSINVQFNLKKESYIFKGIKAVSTNDEEASRDDCIEFTITDRDDDKGIYKIEIKVVKDASDIMIVPDCILVPGVVKEECFPSFDASGWEQDSTIRIAFNKPVIATDEFGVIITDVGGSDMSTFYGEPFFSADKTTLFIPINKSKKIINDDDNISTKDIIVKIDLTTIKDEEDNTGSGLFEYKFRVNKTKDTEPPTFVSANVYTSSDKTRQITTNHPDTWTNENDYSANHLRNSVFVEFQATDEGSGISGIFVKEKVIKFSDGTAASESEEAISYHSDDTCVLDEATGNYVLNYTIGTLYDGIIQLQIFPEDYSFNHSTGSKTVYVLKDTTIEGGRVKFIQEVGQFEKNQEAWLNNIPTVMENDNDKQKVVLTLSPDAKDYYYGNYATEYELKVSWKYENDNDKDYKLLTKNSQNNYEFIRDVNKLVFIKVECKDILGNTKTIIKRMAPRLELQYTERGIGILNFQSLLLLNGIHENNLDISVALRDYCIPIYRYYYDSENTENFYEAVDFGPEEVPAPAPLDLIHDLKRCYELINAENKPSTPTGPFRMYVVPIFGDFPAPISINYIGANITAYEPAGNAYTLTVLQASSTTKGTVYSGRSGPEDVSYFNDTFKITATPLEDSGCYRIKIDDYMTPAGIANNVTYTFLAFAWQKKYPDQPVINILFDLSTKSKNPEFLLNSESNYVIYIEGTDSDGNTYIPSVYPPAYTDTVLEQDIANGFSFYLNSETTPTNTLDLTKDLSAPYLPKNNYPFSEPGCYSIPIPQDGNLSSLWYNGPSIIKNEYGNAEISYYIIPIPTGNRKYVPSYTIDELETYYKDLRETIDYPYDSDPNMTENKIGIPYGDLKDGFYTISIVTQDVNNNRAVETYPFIKNSLGKLPYTLERYSQYWEFTLDPSKNPEIKRVSVGDNQYKPSVEIYLQWCTFITENQPAIWDSSNNNNQIVYEPGTGESANLYTKTLEETIFPYSLIDNDPNGGRWYRIRAIYGFNDSDSTSGKGFYDYEYVFLGGNPDCSMTNCVEGINGIQVYCDNKVLAHTMYSKTKLTDSKYVKNAASIWENKGAETGLRIINNEPVNTSTYEKPVKMFTYSASNYDFVPTGYFYTTIFHFANGSVAMTDIKQKQ